MTEELLTIEATIDTVIYRNAENGYAVLRVSSSQGQSLVAVGCVPNAGVGETLVMQGVFGSHPSYGEQFKISAFERRRPETESAMLDYLSSGVIRGIGKRTAEKIVERFGTETFDVLENYPERLSQIDKITLSKAKQICNDFNMQSGISRVMDFLAENSLPPMLALTLYKTYGNAAISAIKLNPYILVTPEQGVPFSQVDRLAISMGVHGDSTERLQAAIIYELTYNAEEGHTFVPFEKLCEITCALIGVSQDKIAPEIHALEAAGKIVSEDICNVRACYLKWLYECETFVAHSLAARLSSPTEFDYSELIEQAQLSGSISYAPAQKLAINKALNHQLFILTGGPGTGKTTIIRGMLTIFKKMRLRVALAAPTGRAAKKMSEFCGCEAKTVHRMLEMAYAPEEQRPVFGKNHDTPLSIDVLIVDELSMVDITLMAAILDALPPACKLIMVGDADQLPSVGAGNVLKDLIASETIATVRLTEIFRQAAQSAIITSAHAVKSGAIPDLTVRDNDLFFMCRRNYEDVISTICELCKTRLPSSMGILPSQIQVLTVSKKHGAGTYVLNKRLQEAINPPDEFKAEKQFGEKLFRVGDRVMQTRNNYDLQWFSTEGYEEGLGVFNGDVGEIALIDNRAGVMTILFDERRVEYPFDMINEIELAYAMTVHKSQGSEFRAVIFACLDGPSPLLHRSVLYTAMTRARELLIFVGTRSTIEKMTNNNRHFARYSALRTRMITLVENNLR